MDLTEKESTDSGSGSPVETESPEPPLITAAAVVSPAVPEPAVMNMAVGVTENSSLEAKIATTDGGGGGGGVVVGSGDLVMVTAGTGSVSGSAGGKKKRGRPRKYDSEGNLRIPNVASAAGTGSPQTGFTLTSPNSSSHSHSQYSSSSSSKRGRGGRPSPSGNWQLLASLGELFVTTACDDFTPHVVNVNTGEDVAGKIINFSPKGLRGVCVLSANGTISNVTIRQPGSSGGLLTYEGRFEILSLTGSYTISGDGIIKSRTGGLSVSLAGPDGRVIGGGVAGSLLAASPIQVCLFTITLL
ncbi:OLC1v1034349C2 [Oldenlandia corymbosa var. corymbosa]|uniref:AT-hook motif nuclear-localized protein n=1 Tax=Oldenlandia corymbosa var. corymbosa TaxID=529605 RepID=A0AAV1CQI3_OLDCO|nr:OLC1v1034349C2 [Oldenlandia corymbosa var. corymbosa]